MTLTERSTMQKFFIRRLNVDVTRMGVRDYPNPFTSADAFDSVKKAMTEEERLNYYNNLFTAFDRFRSGQSIYYGFSFSYWLEFDCELSLKAELAARAMGWKS